ncbi:M56 family metallopeptidase [Streptomyces sp. NPDC015684]|uniref:M56 family metallopeptidase n=1 Tax=Streptomyces sp. NPDC015684 TaxID=3364963 RepID=UPI0036F576C7
MTSRLLLLCALALAAAVPVARALNRATWPERSPVLGLWVWQCLVTTALLSCLTAPVLGTAAVFRTVRDHLFGSAPPGVAAAYQLFSAPGWTTALTLPMAAGAAWTVAVLVGQLRAVRRARGAARARLRERAPELPAGLPAGRGPLLVLEEEYPDAWWMPGSPSRLVVTTGALRRLTDRQLDVVLTHERGHARARHDWLVELAADDTAARHCGHVTTALALVELNQHRGVLSCASSRRLLDDRVNRLLTPPPTLEPRQRTRIAIAAALGPLLPLLIGFAPGIDALD